VKLGFQETKELEDEARQVFCVLHCALSFILWTKRFGLACIALHLHGVTSKNALGFCKRKREKVCYTIPRRRDKESVFQ